MLSYIVLNYNDYDTTLRCIECIKDYSCIDHIIVVDNCSTDNSYELLKMLQTDKIDVISTKYNGGYGYGNNFGIKYARKAYNSDYAVISNPDVLIKENAVKTCLSFLKSNKKAAVVSPIMRNMDGTLNYQCAWKIPTYWEYLLFSTYVGKRINNNYTPKELESSVLECECVAGSWLMINVELFCNAGMYDENIFLYCEETVLGIRLNRSGYKSYLITTEEFLHMHSVSINKSINSKLKQQKMMWKSRLFVLDNYYNCPIVNKVISRIIYICALLEREAIAIVHMIQGR